MTATTTANTVVLHKRASGTRFQPTFDHLTAEASWATDDGYVVHRTTQPNGNSAFWVLAKNGRYSQQTSLTDARADIAWCRDNGR